jgi:hypothetical protein
MKRLFILLLFIIMPLLIYSKPSKLIFIEQIYKLYESNLHSQESEHKRNILWLENSLKLPNIHPSMAIVVTKTWPEYVKYKKLLRFHINFLLTKEYMDWGWEYDKRDVVFYNMEWADKIKESFKVARSRYELAKYYWDETKKWSKYAYDESTRVGWDQIEDLNWKIENDQFDYDYDIVIDLRLKKLDEKLKKIDDYMKNTSGK